LPEFGQRLDPYEYVGEPRVQEAELTEKKDACEYEGVLGRNLQSIPFVCHEDEQISELHERWETEHLRRGRGQLTV